MNTVVMLITTVLVFGIVIYMLIKKMDIKTTLFAMGIVLMYVAVFMGNDIAIKDFTSTGVKWLDPLAAVISQFKTTISGAGLIILVLGGYSSYMSSIGANDVTVHVLTKPVMKIKSVYILVPFVFVLVNVLSLVIPSASNLAIILLATLYPVLRSAGMSSMTAAAIIATAATVMPTPLGGDNVAIANELANYPQYAGLTVTDYVIQYHAIISVPTLFVMAIAHFFWQKHMDKHMPKEEGLPVASAEVQEIEGSKLFKIVYAILPVFPILLLIAIYIMQTMLHMEINISVEVASIFSLIIAIFCELIRKKGSSSVLAQTEEFFKGMGNSMSIVALLVSASVFVLGLNSIGLISTLQNLMTSIKGNGLGFILPLILVGLSLLIVFLSGSGTALFYAMVPLMMPLAIAAGINATAISVPMALAGNLMRAVSPVAAVTVIVAGFIKVNPLELVKRTSVPMLSGIIFMFIFSMMILL